MNEIPVYYYDYTIEIKFKGISLLLMKLNE